MNVVKNLGLVVAVVLSTGAFAEAEDSNRSFGKLPEKGSSIVAVTPIFGQLLKMSYPQGFAPAFENTKADFYIQESVPTGENVKDWNQMITVTGRKDLASKPELTPIAFLSAMAGGFPARMFRVHMSQRA